MDCLQLESDLKFEIILHLYIVHATCAFKNDPMTTQIEYKQFFIKPMNNDRSRWMQITDMKGAKNATENVENVENDVESAHI